MPPDPKRRSGKPHRDGDAVYSKLLFEPWCRVCRKPAGSAHHIAGRKHVDDRPEVIVPLCGTGTTGCHGLIENRDEETSRKLGERLKSEEVAAVVNDLGPYHGPSYLQRRYHMAVDDPRFAVVRSAD